MPGVDVADPPGEGHRVGADPFAQSGIQVRGRGDLDDLLVPALHRAVALEEVDDVAGGVGQDLHLDVPRLDRPPARGRPSGRRTPTRPRASRPRPRPAAPPGRSTRRIPRPPPPATALTKTGNSSSSAAADDLGDVGRRGDALEHRHARPRGPRRSRVALLPVRCSTLGGGPMKVMPVALAGLGQQRVLGQEAVAGIDRVRPGLQRRADDRLGVEVGPHRVPALADLVRRVGLQPVLGVAVLPREDRDRPRAQLVGRTERPDGDLAAVGHQHGAEHESNDRGSGAGACRGVHQSKQSS